jgi:hypothetical protein
VWIQLHSYSTYVVSAVMIHCSISKGLIAIASRVREACVHHWLRTVCGMASNGTIDKIRVRHVRYTVYSHSGTSLLCFYLSLNTVFVM